MYTALQATSLTLSKYIEDRLKLDPTLSSFFTLGNMVVSLRTPEEMVKKPEEGVSIWLYRVMRDEERLNDPPERIAPDQVRQPPLPLRLHYLVTPVTDKKQGASPETEQMILGKVLQAFHGHPTLRGVDLQGDFAGTTTKLNVRLEAMTLEEIAQVWQGLEGSYQLSVSYEVTVVNIYPELQPTLVSPVDTVMPDYAEIISSEPI
jgi:hypothetical protein